MTSEFNLATVLQLAGIVALGGMMYATNNQQGDEIALLRQNVANLQARVAEMGGRMSCQGATP